ncbi:MAG: ATPase, T2SS/T4P/T4SS family [Candidatus Anstonellales archaeon]
MCNLIVEGTRGIVDLAKCPYEFGSAEFLNYHLKDLSTLDIELTSIRYEEEMIVELDAEKTRILIEYAKFIREIENILLDKKVYGIQQDPSFEARRDTLRKFYEYLFMNPIMAESLLSNYNEEFPDRSLFVGGHKNFMALKARVMEKFKGTKLYKLVKEKGDLREAFLYLVGLKSTELIETVMIELPEGAVPLEGRDARYTLPYGNEVQIYDVPERDTYIYVERNRTLEMLPEHLKALMKEKIEMEMRESFENADYEILMDLKTKEYKQWFVDEAIRREIDITPDQALVMGREVASWVVGAGAQIEALALDRKYITDIYLDSENSPIYLEHQKFGICHTLSRYNRDMVERAFKNIVMTLKGVRKFDENNPVVDVVVKRLSMRCHLQRPPATFGELQGAFRIMKETPFTYPLYLNYKSFTPFFAGYDDVMVTLGSSEAVLGLKGVGKTAFTAAKITAIGTRRRIIPIQDIEEIPVRAFRKRGFHIGAARVMSSEKEEAGAGTKELDLISMANALLRMGDAALIINEIRSRVAVQGVVNLLNTQPGVFLLYNLHAESLKDIQERLELVFGIPSASMFATDRYTFLKKVKFGRKGRIYRVLGYEFESDIEQRAFAKVFDMVRGHDIESCYTKPLFLKNPEANSKDADYDFNRLEKDLDIEFVPPALKRRAADTGISPEQYILQAFYKGRVYEDIRKLAEQNDNELILELDFVVKANNLANKILKELENENGEVDYKTAIKMWNARFAEFFKKEKLLLEREKRG